MVLAVRLSSSMLGEFNALRFIKYKNLKICFQWKLSRNVDFSVAVLSLSKLYCIRPGAIWDRSGNSFASQAKKGNNEKHAKAKQKQVCLLLICSCFSAVFLLLFCCFSDAFLPLLVLRINASRLGVVGMAQQLQFHFRFLALYSSCFPFPPFYLASVCLQSPLRFIFEQ